MSAAQYYQEGQNGSGYQPPVGGPPQQRQQYQEQYPQQQQYQPPSQPPPTMNGSAPYANEAAPPPYKDTAPFTQATEKTGQRLNPRKRLNDPIFLILFLANVAGFAVLSGIAINSFIAVNGDGGGLGNDLQGGTGTSATLDYHTVYLLLLVCALGLAIAAVYLGLVRAFTKIIMEITLALTVLLNIAICIYYYYIKYWSGAIIFTVIALISVFFYWSMRKRIPLAKLLLQVTIDITKHHPSVYLVVFIGLFLQAAISVWYTFTCVAVYVKWTPGSASCSTTSCSSSKVAGLIFYSTFSYLWISQVVANVILATLAGGVFGGWYYYGPRAADGTGLPKRATLKAFVRASTLSLGSIAFGSLIVTLLELLRLILQSVSQYEAGQGDMVGEIISCIAACCIGCIAQLVAWFNKLRNVFTPFHECEIDAALFSIEIALYGKSYLPAAKDTWALMKDRGVDALVNDSLVGTVLLWGAYVNGFLCALFGYLYLRFTNPAYNTSGQYSAPVILFSFLIGLNESFTISSAIDAGVSTIFVGLGEDPMVLADRSPALFEEIRQNYPRVVEGVPHRN
ncbi:hypothetical protein P7C73_g2079, partial [Tremellales sp. Uapishka_1]